MSDDQPTDVPPSKLLTGGALKLRLAAASLIFLAVGALVAPTAGPTTLAVPEERPAPLLEEQVQQRATVRPFRGVSEMAGLVSAHGVAIAAPPTMAPPVWSDYATATRRPQPSGYGVFVSEALALTHAAALDGRLTVKVSTVDGRSLESSLVGYDPATELALLSVPGAAVPPAALASTFAEAGALGAGVVRQGGRTVVMSVFFAGLDGERYLLSHGNELTRPGLPIFNMDGQLVAITGSPSTAPDAIAAGPVLGRLLAQASGSSRPASLGIEVQEIPRALRPLLGDEGVLVARVIAEGPAANAGIAAGEVLQAINAVDVSAPETISKASETWRVGVPVVLQIDRRGQRVPVEVTPRSTYEIASLARTAPPDDRDGIPVEALFSEAALAEAGLQPTALVQRIDGRPVVSQAQAIRDIRRARRPLSLYVYDRSTWFFAGIEAR